MNDLWDYAVEVYEREGVKERLLELQDRHHLNVNIVLWCLWAGHKKLQLTDTEAHQIISCVEDMARHTTERLRGVRRFLSTPRVGFDDGAREQLRKDVLGAELLSEKLIIERLGTSSLEVCRPGTSDRTARAISQRLFTLARTRMDMPTMIEDEESPESPNGCFQDVLSLVEDHR